MVALGVNSMGQYIFKMVSSGLFFVRALDLAGHSLRYTGNRNISGCQMILPGIKNQKC